MKRTSPLVRFFAAAVAWLVALTVAWSFVSDWTTHPAAALSHMALEFGAPQWVRSVEKAPGTMEVETRILVAAPGQPRGTLADIVVEVHPAHYGYGLPIFLALLLAARGRHPVGQALVGYLLLLPGQAFSITLDLLRQMAIPAVGGVKALGIAQWQLELIAFGYQFGTLVLPTLLPVALWLWMNQAFFREVVAAGWRRTPG